MLLCTLYRNYYLIILNYTDKINILYSEDINIHIMHTYINYIILLYNIFTNTT